MGRADREGGEGFAGYDEADAVDSREVGDDLALKFGWEVSNVLRTAVEASLFDRRA